MLLDTWRELLQDFPGINIRRLSSVHAALSLLALPALVASLPALNSDSYNIEALKRDVEQPEERDTYRATARSTK